MDNENVRSSLNYDISDPLSAKEILKHLKLQNVNRLVVGQLNINSISGKFDLLKEVIKDNIDILVITKTKLDNNFPLSQFKMEGFSLPYRKDFNHQGGGVMIFVRDDLACKELHNIENTGEGIFLELNFRKSKWLLFGGYNHTKCNIRAFLGEVSNKLDAYISKYENYIILGDFNSEVCEEIMNEFCEMYNLKNLIREPTCFKSYANPSSIDLILTNKYKSFISSQVVETGLSDHHKLTISVLRMFVKKQSPLCIKYRDYKHFDNLSFNNELSKKLEQVNPADLCYDMFENIFMNILNKNAKVKKKYLRANNAPFMNKTLSRAIMNRSRLKNRFLKNPNNENELNYKKQRNYCVNVLNKAKKKYFNSLNNRNISNNKEFWKVVKPFFSEKTTINRIILLVENDKIISDDQEVAELMNNYFSNVVPLLDIQGYNYIYDRNSDEISNIINKFNTHPSITKIKDSNIIDEPFFFSIPDLQEMENEVIKLNNNKPTTDNNIPPKILKQNINICTPYLTKIYGDSVNTENFPAALKKADITPGHKKGVTTDKGNYRPVSILPSVSKFFERNMYRDIDNYMQRYLSPSLCGFRKGYSTQHCLLVMLENFKKALDSNCNAAALLTDLSKAFDCIDHELLIAKLSAYGFSHSALNYIYSYLA